MAAAVVAGLARCVAGPGSDARTKGGPYFARAERRKRESAEYIIDGTERRRQRPKKPAKQALHYSGKEEDEE